MTQMGGAFMAQMGGAVMAQMGGGSYGKVSYCFWKICLKNAGLQGSTLSGHRMTTGFGPLMMCKNG